MESKWAKDLHKVLCKSKAVTVTGSKAIVVLVDGDLIAYRCAAATDGASWMVSTTSGVVEEFKYHADALMCEKRLIDSGESTAVTRVYNPEPEAYALYNMEKGLTLAKVNIETLYKRPAEMRIFLTSDHLFRESVCPTYKKSRVGNRKPTHLSACKKHLMDKYDAEIVPGYEADDLIAMMANTYDKDDYVVMSLDKDLKQIPGEHYDFVKCLRYAVSEDVARYNFWCQVLEGDKTDDITGLVGCGPVGAHKILKDCLESKASEHEYYRTVLEAYLARTKRLEDESDKDFATRCVSMLGTNARLLWLCREPEQLWDVPKKES